LTKVWDAVVIGSGFGGSMVADELVRAGLDVLMLERGDWVERGPHNWDATGSVDLTPYFTGEPPYRVAAGGNGSTVGSYSCVGGPSVFYGGVSVRFREKDFVVDTEIGGASGAAWPYDYEELEPWYARAEALLGVAGTSDEDPTEPRRSGPYPNESSALSDTSARIAGAARDLGLSPFRLPLAINYAADNGRAACVACTTCDTFACAISAKNDLATVVLPHLVARGLEIRPNTVVTNLLVRDGRCAAVECHDKASGRREQVRATTVVLSAGALGTPHVLLASELDAMNPAGHLVGRNLMRHCSAIAFGAFPRRPNRRQQFHKQIGIHDFYFGHPWIQEPAGKLGSLQQLATPPAGLVRGKLPRVLGPFVGRPVDHFTGLLAMAEDQPQLRNGVHIDWRSRDRYGLPELTISHRHSERDLLARKALVRQSKRILRRAGAPVSYVHQIKSFSHALGTVRFGSDPETSVLDETCRFRGIDNLHVVDASFMPTSGGVNPSLTISANALRVGNAIARG
jgi:choline dehydrogenase-like flavoprotein